MIVQLNPLKWFAPKAVAVSAPVAPVVEVSLVSKAAQAEESVMGTVAVGLPKKVSFLDHVGHFFKNLLHIGVEVAQIAEPFVAVAFPEVVPIYASAIGLAVTAQATASTATGTGPQKLAQVASTLVPQAQAWAKQNGILWPDAEITKWASAVVDTLNLIPAPTAAPVAVVAAPAAAV